MVSKSLQDKIKSLKLGDIVEIVLKAPEWSETHKEEHTVGYYVRYNKIGTIDLGSQASFGYFTNKKRKTGPTFPCYGVDSFDITNIKRIRRLK